MSRAKRKLVVESLTDRIVPATATLDAGTLYVSGAGDLKVQQSGNKVTVGGTDIFDVAQGISRKSVNTSEIGEIRVDGDGGPNLIDLRTVRFLSAQIKGEGGDDTIYATQRNDNIDAGEGADFVRGEDGNDLIHGRTGNDRLYGNKGGDTIYGDEDEDYIEGNECQVIHSTGGYVYMFPNYLYGNDADDVIISDYCGDYMYGGEGNDEMEGNGGDDFMYGEEDNDIMSGGGGNDFMEGEDGDDDMSGDAGNDNMEGGAGEDEMHGGAGNDHMDSGADNDVANGDAGNDSIDLGAGNDTSNGGPGHDEIDGDIGDDEVRGGPGNDLVDTGAGNDTAFGEAGNDNLELGDDFDHADGGGGHDWIIGGAGPDVLGGFDGNDIIDGEEGIDVISGGIGNDLIDGGEDNDILNGELGNDFIEGDEGDDELHGGIGRDILLGGPGRDHLDGGTQRDIFFGDEEGENLFDTLHFDTYEDHFNLSKPVFGTMAIGDIARQDPHLEATLVGLGAAVQKVGSKVFLENLEVVSPGNYKVQLHGEANPRDVAFDGNWSDNEPIPNAEERLLSPFSAAEKNEFWTILFSRARLAKYTVDPAPFHTDAAWNTAHTSSGNKLLNEEEAFHDYSPSTSSPPHDLATLAFEDLQQLIKEHAAIIAVAAAGTGLSTDKIELGSGYVVTSAFVANGKQWVRLYNVTGHDTEPHGEKVDNAPGAKKDDGFITLEFVRFKDPSNFAELHAWI